MAQDALGSKTQASGSHVAAVLAGPFAGQPRMAHSLPSHLLLHHSTSCLTPRQTCEAASPCHASRVLPASVPGSVFSRVFLHISQAPALWVHPGLISDPSRPPASPPVSSPYLPLDFYQGSPFSPLPAFIPYPPTSFLAHLCYPDHIESFHDIICCQ